MVMRVYASAQPWRPKLGVLRTAQLRQNGLYNGVKSIPTNINVSHSFADSGNGRIVEANGQEILPILPKGPGLSLLEFVTCPELALVVP
jgi:hypothetical protein